MNITILTQLNFDVNRRGTICFDTLPYITWYKPSNMMQNGKQQTQLRLYKVMFVNH